MCRAKANLIKSFIETACGKTYKVNQYHKVLYDHYVLEDGEPDPGRPPYYSKDMFQIIKEAQQSDLVIECLSLKDWYQRLIERDVTHNSSGDDSERVLIESRTEYIYPMLIL